MSTDQADGARGRELHAGLAQCVASGEVVGCVDLNGNHTLATLDTGSRADVLSEGAPHALRDTVCTGTSCLLVFTQHVVGEGVDTEGVALCTGFLSNGGVRDHTGGFKRSVANLNVVVGTEFEHDLELAGLRSTTVSNVVLVDTVVGHTTDVLSAGVGWAFQAAVHHSGFSCHRYASKQSCDRCSLYDISAPFIHAQRRATSSSTGKVFMLLPPLHPIMADGWRRLLEEESEHQWLTLSLFAVFVAVGAFAINATEHFVGDSIENSGAQHQGGLVTHIEYDESGQGYTALVYAPGEGYHMFTEHQDGTVTSVYSPQTNDMGSRVNFMRTMPSGELLFSVAPNQVMGIQNNLLITYDYSEFDETFTVLDAADSITSDGTDRLVLTAEGANTSVRGIANGVPTQAMSMSSGVQWQGIEAHSEGLWVAYGTHSSSSGADGSSPATPKSRPALGWITWSGDGATPVLRNVNMEASGVFHSLAWAEDTLVVGGTVESMLITPNQDVSILAAPAARVVSDADGTVWFIGALGSSSIASYDATGFEVHPLSRHVPVDVTDAGTQGVHVHVHGVDADGLPVHWSIDTTADGSIESGRGFLNLMFLIFGSVMLGMMASYAGRQLIAKN